MFEMAPSMYGRYCRMSLEDLEDPSFMLKKSTFNSERSPTLFECDHPSCIVFSRFEDKSLKLVANI